MGLSGSRPWSVRGALERGSVVMHSSVSLALSVVSSPVDRLRKNAPAFLKFQNGVGIASQQSRRRRTLTDVPLRLVVDEIERNCDSVCITIDRKFALHQVTIPRCAGIQHGPDDRKQDQLQSTGKKPRTGHPICDHRHARFATGRIDGGATRRRGEIDVELFYHQLRVKQKVQKSVSITLELKQAYTATVTPLEELAMRDGDGRLGLLPKRRIGHVEQQSWIVFENRGRQAGGDCRARFGAQIECTLVENCQVDASSSRVAEQEMFEIKHLTQNSPKYVC